LSTSEPLSTNMKAAIGLLEIFLAAIIIAFAITFATGTLEMRLLAVVFVVPIAALSLIFIHYCGRRKAWGYAGAMILGIIGVLFVWP